MTHSAVTSFPLLAVLLLTGCGGTTLDDLETEARAALASGDPIVALRSADEGLALARTGSADKATLWSFEDLRVQALAKAGNADETIKELDRLSGAYPSQVTSALYTKLTQYVMAIDLTGAVAVLDAGAKRFPGEEAAFKQLAEGVAKRAEESGDTAAMEALDAIPYL